MSACTLSKRTRVHVHPLTAEVHETRTPIQTQTLCVQTELPGDYPGPLPVIIHDMVIDEVQIAQAAAVKAEGIVLSAGVLGDELLSMVTAAREYGLEPLVVVRTEDEVASALAAEVEVIAVNGLSVDEMVSMVDVLPDTVVKVAFLPLYDDKQLIEAEDSASGVLYLSAKLMADVTGESTLRI